MLQTILMFLAMAPGPELPRPPAAIHLLPPQSHTVTSSYACPKGQRVVSIDITPNAPPKLVSATRNNAPASAAVKRTINDALGKLETVTFIIPECLENRDQLLVIGRFHQKQVALTIDWIGDRVSVSAPQPIRLSNEDCP